MTHSLDLVYDPSDDGGLGQTSLDSHGSPITTILFNEGLYKYLEVSNDVLLAHSPLTALFLKTRVLPYFESLQQVPTDKKSPLTPLS
eukprot:COSAG04_NODE_9283_length_878_cov_1.220796_1_plen_86_part_10